MSYLFVTQVSFRQGRPSFIAPIDEVLIVVSVGSSLFGGKSSTDVFKVFAKTMAAVTS